MKKLITLCITLFSFFGVKAQTQNPVNWLASYKAINATEGEITITAKIEKGWHMYSIKPTDAGPISTTFTFVPSGNYALNGQLEENNAHEEFDKAFEAKLFIFYDLAVFKQKVKAVKKGAVIAIKLEYTCCNDNMCLPPKTIDLSVKTQ